MSARVRPRHFLDRLRAPVREIEVQRHEQAIAAARTLLVLALLAAPPSELARREPIPAIVSTATVYYLYYSVAVLAFVLARPRAALTVRASIHIGDLVWLAVITARPTPAFFVFSTFALLAAAYRWGFHGTAATAAAALAVIPLQTAAALIAGTPPPGVRPPRGDLNGLVVRSAHLLTVGLLLGYLAEREKRLRAEAAVVARLLARAQPDRGLRRVLGAVFSELQDIFGAPRIVLIVRERATGRVVRWDAAPADAPPLATEVAHDDKDHGLPPAPDGTWHARIESHGRVGVHRLPAGARREGRSDEQTAALLAAFGARALLRVGVRAGDEWDGSLFIVDPEIPAERHTWLRLAETLVRESAPAVHSAYLIQRLRGHAGAIERTRIARELHDGIVQSLVGLEMQLDVVRRRLLAADSPVAGEVLHVERLLHDEVLNIRALMQQMRTRDVGPADLVECLTDLVERFRHDTGIETRFISDVDEVRPTPRACRELVRVVQEALVNVRKHSGARHAHVRLTLTGGRLMLVIKDDGRGFPFTGHFSAAELDARRCGPYVIRERVRSMGGELTLESSARTGAELLITVPAGGA